MRGTIRLQRQELLDFWIVMIHVIFLVSLKTFSFYKFVRHLFYFYIIFVLKINIAFVFVSVNDCQSISVFVIVNVTEISLKGFGAMYQKIKLYKTGNSFALKKKYFGTGVWVQGVRGPQHCMVCGGR